MLFFLINIWGLAILTFILIKEKVGVALLISYVILMPYFQSLMLHTVALALFVFTKLRKNERPFKNIVPIKPFLLFYLAFLFLILFQNLTPFTAQLGYFANDVLTTIPLALMIWWEMNTDTTSFPIYKKVVIICIVIAAVYGLILTQASGENPYLFSLMDEIKMDADSIRQSKEYFQADDSRLFGRISSVFQHPMTFALFLGLSCIYFFSVSKSKNKRNNYLFAAILGLSVLFCGVRSVLGGLAVAGLIYVVSRRKIKMSFPVFVILTLSVVFVLQMPSVVHYIGSVFGQGDEGSGSSLEMRSFQFLGCISEMQDSPIIGKGYGWHKFYLDEFGDHPIMYAFESLIFIILCDGGIIGALIWIGLLVKIYKTTKRGLIEDSVYLFMLFGFYFSYSCITGEYGYMKFLLIFYVLLYYEKLGLQEEPLQNSNIKKKRLWINR